MKKITLDLKYGSVNGSEWITKLWALEGIPHRLDGFAYIDAIGRGHNWKFGKNENY